MLSASITTLVSFDGLNGNAPSGDLAISGNTLYGTTQGPDLNGDAEVFSLPTSGGMPTILASSALYSLHVSGATLYGITLSGGPSDNGGVSSLPVSGGTPTVLAGTDGFDTQGLIVSGNTLYGTISSTQGPGGEVFSLPITGGTPTVLATFNASNGGDPSLGLISSGSTLYGETDGDGDNGDGEVFSLPAAGGTPTVLGTFDSSTGYRLSGNLILSGNSLYGTASDEITDKDEIFSLPVTGGTPSILASLDTIDGNISMILSGNTLYGTAADGGGPGFDGGVFSLPTSGGNPTIMALFNGTDGSEPNALVLSGNTLYGTTHSGGASQYDGTVFSLPVTATAAGLMVDVDPPSQTVNAGDAATFTASVQGNPTPSAQWYVQEPGASTFTRIAGATSSTYIVPQTTDSETGSQYEAIFTNSLGSVTTIPAQLNVLTVLTPLASFNGDDGQNPGGIVVSGGTLYGVTAGGGASGDGEVFSVPLTGGTPTVLASFDASDAGPMDLIVSGNALYGMTLNSVGSSSTGTVFSLPITGGTPTVLASFIGQDSQPGALCLSEGILYGAVNNVGFGGYEIFSLPETGGTPTILASDQESNYISCLAVSGGTVYAGLAGYGEAGGVILSVPASGGPTAFLAEVGADGYGRIPTSLIISGNTLFYSIGPSVGQGDGDDGDEGIFSVPTSGGNSAVLHNFGPDGAQYDLTLSNGILYGISGGYAFSLPEGGGTPALLAQFASVPGDLIRSGNVLYGTLSSDGTNSDGEVFALPVAATAPTVTTDPTDRSISAGQKVAFHATAFGYPTPTVQWYVEKAGTDTFEAINGATSASYEVTKAAVSENGNLYEAVFTNSNGSATTTAAKLEVVDIPTISSTTRSTTTHTRTIPPSVTATDPADPAALKFTWTAIHLPAGAKPPNFTANGTNAAKNTIARFTKAGGYILRCEAKNAAGNTATTDISVTVIQTATSLKIQPHHATVPIGKSITITATELDQFAHPMADQPTPTFSLLTGPGTLNPTTGLFTATASGAALIQVEDANLAANLGLHLIG